MRVYLAGPDVFLPEPVARGARLKAICARYGLEGVFPLDPFTEPAEWAALPHSHRIARKNEGHIAACAALIANLTPFRGPSADVGTVFELGFMRALGRPVFGWSNAGSDLATRTRAWLGHHDTRDDEGLHIEDFGLCDNLMIEAAIVASGGVTILQDCDFASRWDHLEAFERCVAALQRTLNP